MACRPGLRSARAVGALRVDDDGTGPSRPSAVPGYGLVGMRERVTGVGGTLRAEPGPDSGFSVLAQLPAGSAS